MPAVIISSEKCELRGVDNDQLQGQISEYIFAPIGVYRIHYPSNISCNISWKLGKIQFSFSQVMRLDWPVARERRYLTDFKKKIFRNGHYIFREANKKKIFLGDLFWKLYLTRFNRECARDVIKNNKGFIQSRHKRNWIYICLLFSSSMASLVWKPARFEFQSYSGSWNKAKIAIVEKYSRNF